MSKLNHILYKASLMVEQMDLNDCIVVVACVVATGWLCMRGMGSDSSL